MPQSLPQLLTVYVWVVAMVGEILLCLLINIRLLGSPSPGCVILGHGPQALWASNS